MLRAFPRIGGLDQRFEHVDGDSLDAVADGELVAPGEFLNRRHQPHQKLIVSLNCRARAFGIVRHRNHTRKKLDQGFALDPRGKEVKIQGVSVLPSRKPILPLRLPVVLPLRVAERRLRGPLLQEPPRTTRKPQSSMLNAEPSVGAPL